jgi:hypothetical protein
MPRLPRSLALAASLAFALSLVLGASRSGGAPASVSVPEENPIAAAPPPSNAIRNIKGRAAV